jgi:hypothetical protein
MKKEATIPHVRVRDDSLDAAALGALDGGLITFPRPEWLARRDGVAVM